MPFPNVGGGSGPHNILSTTHPDTDAADVPNVGDVASWDGTKWIADVAPAGTPGSTPVQIDIGDAQAGGAATSYSRNDHQHANPAPASGYPVDVDFQAEADGTATTPARSDHRHTLTDPPGAPANDVLGTTAGAEGTGTAPARNDHAHGVTAFAFSRGGTILAPAVGFVMVWRAPFACTVTNVRGHRKGGTGATINARRNQTSDHLASDLSLSTADSWTDGGSVQNTAYSAGDDLEIEVASVTGGPTEIAIQVDFTRP